MQNDLKNENPVLDGIDRRLVEMLSANTRTTTADLARQVGMSAPAWRTGCGAWKIPA